MWSNVIQRQGKKLSRVRARAILGEKKFRIVFLFFQTVLGHDNT